MSSFRRILWAIACVSTPSDDAPKNATSRIALPRDLQRGSGDLADSDLARIALGVIADTRAAAEQAKQRAFQFLSYTTALSAFLLASIDRPWPQLSRTPKLWSLVCAAVALILCAKCVYHCLRAVDWRAVTELSGDFTQEWRSVNRAADIVSTCAWIYGPLDRARASRTEHGNVAQSLAGLQTVATLLAISIAIFCAEDSPLARQPHMLSYQGTTGTTHDVAHAIRIQLLGKGAWADPTSTTTVVEELWQKVLEHDLDKTSVPEPGPGLQGGLY